MLPAALRLLAGLARLHPRRAVLGGRVACIGRRRARLGRVLAARRNGGGLLRAGSESRIAARRGAARAAARGHAARHATPRRQVRRAIRLPAASSRSTCARCRRRATQLDAIRIAAAAAPLRGGCGHCATLIGSVSSIIVARACLLFASSAALSRLAWPGPRRPHRAAPARGIHKKTVRVSATGARQSGQRPHMVSMHAAEAHTGTCRQGRSTTHGGMSKQMEHSRPPSASRCGDGDCGGSGTASAAAAPTLPTGSSGGTTSCEASAVGPGSWAFFLFLRFFLLFAAGGPAASLASSSSAAASAAAVASAAAQCSRRKI